MEPSAYNNLAEEALQNLAERIEAADEKGILEDVMLHEGVLTIELADGGQYVINKHTPSQQIWFSSPVSGAGRFDYVEEGRRWRDSKNRDLFHLLHTELRAATGLNIIF